MRKRNDSSPPELRPNTRLINAAVEGRKCKRPNALKHGLFSGAVLIPGEDSGQYKQLLTELMDQYKPAGPTLQDEATPEKLYPITAHCSYVQSSYPFLQ